MLARGPWLGVASTDRPAHGFCVTVVGVSSALATERTLVGLVDRSNSSGVELDRAFDDLEKLSRLTFRTDEHELPLRGGAFDLLVRAPGVEPVRLAGREVVDSPAASGCSHSRTRSPSRPCFASSPVYWTDSPARRYSVGVTGSGSTEIPMGRVSVARESTDSYSNGAILDTTVHRCIRRYRQSI